MTQTNISFTMKQNSQNALDGSVKMKAVQYKYRNLLGEMARHGDNLKTLSAKLGMSYQTLSARLQGKRKF